ncbi:MAG TPA: hypothetical protein VEY30_10645 [Myxococcaceae bacterium]|nr:hypothetical protein [Myxococcaceae bacterium]
MKTLSWGVLVCTAALALAGCGDEEATTCTTNADCAAEGEICNTLSGQCAQTCESAADCPQSAKTCDTLAGVGGGTARFCQCSTNALCADELGDGATCDQASKSCVTDGSATDGGTDETCDDSEQQPAGCAYGTFCDNGDCAAVATPTCENFENRNVSWNPSSSTGPVIYNLNSADPDDSFCGAGSQAFTATMQAYSPNTPFPELKSGLQGFFYVQVNGQQLDATASFRQTDYDRSADGKQITVNLTFCGAPANTSISVGLYFTGGNPYCAQIIRD